MKTLNKFKNNKYVIIIVIIYIIVIIVNIIELMN